MERQEALETLLRSFKRYYNINTDHVKEPFAAEAEFHSHDENYFLTKSVKLFESESKEYVYFASEESLNREKLLELDRIAWETGLSRVELREGHKSTDVTLVILADHIDEDVFPLIKKTKHYKSYSFSFKGWSNYRLIALELSTGRMAFNRQGQSLEKLLANIK